MPASNVLNNPSAGNTPNLDAHPALASLSPKAAVATSTQNPVQNGAANQPSFSIISAFWPRRWTLHSPPILAGFTILTAFLVYLAVIHVRISADLDPLPLPAAKNSSKLKDERTFGAEELTRREPSLFPADQNPLWRTPQPAVPNLAPSLFLPTAAEQWQMEPPSDVQPGEATMYKHLKNGTLQVVLLGWFFGAPVTAALADDKPAPGETADRLLKIERDIADLKKDMKEFVEAMKPIKEGDYLKPIRDDVAQLKTDVNRLQQEPSRRVEVKKPVVDAVPSDLAERVRALEENLQLAVQAQNRDIPRLRQDLAQLQNEVGKLQEAARQQTRTAFAGPVPEGKIRLYNGWMTQMTVILDGQSYRLLPGETRIVNKPAGAFRYEVLGITQPGGLVRTAVAGETYNIEIGVTAR